MTVRGDSLLQEPEFGSRRGVGIIVRNILAELAQKLGDGKITELPAFIVVFADRGLFAQPGERFQVVLADGEESRPQIDVAVDGLSQIPTGDLAFHQAVCGRLQIQGLQLVYGGVHVGPFGGEKEFLLDLGKMRGKTGIEFVFVRKIGKVDIQFLSIVLRHPLEVGMDGPEDIEHVDIDIGDRT